MTEQDQIKRWVDNKIITQKQADFMLADLDKYRSLKRSKNFTVVISVIGAILLGVGAILFVASNWREISNFTKLVILAITTLSAYTAGYLLEYEKKILPKTGRALLFLSALLFGSSIFLVAQMYHIEANSHILLLLWLIGILPLVYIFKSVPGAWLAAVLFLVWFWLFFLLDAPYRITDLFPLLYSLIGILLFGIGGLHDFSDRLNKIGYSFKSIGQKVYTASLFLLTFDFFSGDIGPLGYGINDSYKTYLNLTTKWIIGIAVVSIIILMINAFLNPGKEKTKFKEYSFPLIAIVMGLLFFFYQVKIGGESSLFPLLYNCIFAVFIGFIFYIGIIKENILIINRGIFWLSVFLLARYFDFFWSLLDRSSFFAAGGVILLLGGIFIEKKRKKMKESFN